jgi:hypothetical protein
MYRDFYIFAHRQLFTCKKEENRIISTLICRLFQDVEERLLIEPEGIEIFKNQLP